MSKPSETRDRLTRYIFVSEDPREATGLLEVALEKAIQAEEIERKVDRASRRGLVRRYQGLDWIGEAASKNVITEREANLLREVDALSTRVVAADDFDPDEVRPNYMTAGHNIRTARNAQEG